MTRRRTAPDTEALEQALTAGAGKIGMHGVAAYWQPAMRTCDWQATVPPEAVVLALIDLVERYDTLLQAERLEVRRTRTAIECMVGGARAVLDLVDSAPKPTLFDTAGV